MTDCIYKCRVQPIHATSQPQVKGFPSICNRPFGIKALITSSKTGRSNCVM